MRTAILVAAAFVSLPVAAFGQEPPAFPPGAEVTAARLMTRVGPETSAWLRQEAAREAANDRVWDATATRAVHANRTLGNLSDGDVQAIAFLVLMEAAKSAREDLKAIMADVKQINDAKAALRQPAQGGRTATATPSLTAASATAQQRLLASTTRTAVQPRPMPRSEFEARLGRAKNDLDALNAMGEMESLRLQMVMDRQSKLMSTLSNMLKRMSDTSAAITQNLK